jgi:hypothetical protein
MSRPTIHKPEYYTDTPRTSSLKPIIQTIIEKVKCKDYTPSSKIEPIVSESEKNHLCVCAAHFKNYLECRDINPEYRCEQYKQYMIKLKCI